MTGFTICRLFKAYLLILILLLGVGVAPAQSPKHELRAAWIATVSNIDWPSKQGLPAIEQQQQFIALLNQLQAIGCNAVIVQIRPSCDAFYESEYEPWSHFLSGHQGQPPFPYYDPLIFMIDEAHKRNMEFHAWFNPFRALVDCYQNPNPPKHVTRSHSDWIINYGGKAYIDPGVPEAREYVMRVITDVVRRYDIDAVHLDDYFYPYRIAGTPFGDNKSFAKYGGGMNREDWRRNNVNLFISLLGSEIKNIKPYVKFGVSPFGVWRNSDKDPDGSATHGGQTDYDDLYADVLTWIKKGWIDYLMPQLYWEHASKAAPFGVLLPWWNAHAYGRHVYYGLGAYRMKEHKKGAWQGPGELLWQIKDIRKLGVNTGFSLYSATSLNDITSPIKDSLRLGCNKYIALPPVMKWIDSLPPDAPTVRLDDKAGNSILKWQVKNEKKEPLKYLVYRFAANEKIDLNRSDRIVSLQQADSYIIPAEKTHTKYTYVVTALDRLWNESKPSASVVVGGN